MGALNDAVRAYRLPTKEQLYRIAELMSSEDLADLEGLLADPSVSVPSIRRVVEQKYPDAPKYAQTTWDGWARARRG